MNIFNNLSTFLFISFPLRINEVDLILRVIGSEIKEYKYYETHY